MGHGLGRRVTLLCHAFAASSTNRSTSDWFVANDVTRRTSASPGRNTMPAFGRVYSDADLNDVASYIVDVLAKD